MNNKDIFYLVGLSLIPGIGSVTARQLIAYFGSAKAIFECPKGKLKKVPGVGEILSEEIFKKEFFGQAEKILMDAEQRKLRIVGVNDADYPYKLKQIYDCPLYIYWNGTQSGKYERSVAIVGTRQATEYGKDTTEKIVRELAVFKPVIVSGFAYGIDIIAHRAALLNGLPTIAVLGSGHGKIYPKLHQKYVDPILQNGAVISEYSFNEDPEQKHFPERNRIVAGMVDAVIVVEAAAEGGALITAVLAHSYNTDVFAVPGNLTNKFSEGCNNLIRDNIAGIFTNVPEFAASLNWDKENSPGNKSVLLNKDVPVHQKAVYELLLNQGELHIDDLSWKAQMNMNSLAAMLLEMEIGGIVKPMPGKKFKAV